MATVLPSSMAAFSAMFIANDVFPIEGRAAKNDEVGFLKTAGHLVEIGVVRLEAGDALASLHEGVDATGRGWSR